MNKINFIGAPDQYYVYHLRSTYACCAIEVRVQHKRDRHWIRAQHAASTIRVRQFNATWISKNVQKSAKRVSRPETRNRRERPRGKELIDAKRRRKEKAIRTR